MLEYIKAAASIGTFIAAIVAYKKYKYEKNKEFYLKRLDKVYAPLYFYIVKQEAARELFGNFSNEFKEKYSRHKNPLFELGKESEVLFKPEEFIKLAKKADKSLISPELLNLIGALESTYYLFDDSNFERKSYFMEKRRNIEEKIVNEVIERYMECIEKVDADKIDNIIDIENYKIDEL